MTPEQIEQGEELLERLASARSRLKREQAQLDVVAETLKDKLAVHGAAMDELNAAMADVEDWRSRV